MVCFCENFSWSLIWKVILYVDFLILSFYVDATCSSIMFFDSSDFCYRSVLLLMKLTKELFIQIYYLVWWKILVCTECICCVHHTEPSISKYLSFHRSTLSLLSTLSRRPKAHYFQCNIRRRKILQILWWSTHIYDPCELKHISKGLWLSTYRIKPLIN